MEIKFCLNVFFIILLFYKLNKLTVIVQAFMVFFIYKLEFSNKKKERKNMALLYRSTRGSSSNVIPASEAILKGLSPDGGLYVPTEIPKIDFNLAELTTFSYQELAFRILKLFYTDFSEIELRNCIEKAYGSNFDISTIAPLSFHDNTGYLELFHGPTIAFKDIALQLLPHLMTVAAKKNNSQKDIVILTATSGDTGKAAMEGFADVDGTKIIVFYPQNGVSFIQEQQMLTQKGKNTFVFAVDGNFDIAQTNVKKLLNDPELASELSSHGYQFSSANSINIGRLFPQVVYYFYAYAQMIQQKRISTGTAINFSVPTGNFGNILAGYYAKKMGLPINKLLCASNKNNVLTDFFNEGVYDKNRPFYVTSSPSMDILVSSNLERLLFYINNESSKDTLQLMTQLNEKGKYIISEEIRTSLNDFFAAYADENQTAAEIFRIYNLDGTVIDPHTAVASYVAKLYSEEQADSTPTIVVSTASPYKFPQSVLIGLHDSSAFEPGFPALQALKKISNLAFPNAITQLLNTKYIRTKKIISPVEMKKNVKNLLMK